MLNQHAKWRRAFTLVELLVVIGVIALLIAMLLPALVRARKTASQVACASNLRQIGVAFLQYGAENRDFMPAFQIQTVPGMTLSDIELSSWPYALSRYLGKQVTDPDRPTQLAKLSKVFACAEFSPMTYEGAYCGYGVNFPDVFCNMGPGLCRAAEGAPHFRDYRKLQSTLAMAMDAEGVRGGGGGTLAYLAVFSARVPEGSLGFAIQNGVPYDRHKKGVNVLYFDWHVDWRLRKEIMSKNPANYNQKFWGPPDSHWH